MAVTANQLLSRDAGCKIGYPVAASTHLYQGTFAFVNASGYLDDDTASGVNKFAGVNIDDIENTTVTSGAVSADVWTEGNFLGTGSGFAQTSVGKKVYATDNYTLTLNSYAAGAVEVGEVTEYVSSTQVWFKANPALSGSSQDSIVEVSVSIPLHATKTVFNVLTAREAMQVLNIDYVPDIAQGGALTATVVKAVGTDTPAAATTPMHIAAAINLNGTAHTVQPITLSVTAADLLLVAGDRIAFVESGAMTTGSGCLSIRLRRL